MVLTSCAYHFGHGELSSRYSTLSVPYAEGDEEGGFTAEVIKQLSTSGGFHYVPEGGDLTLKMKFIEFRDENIGFRYDRKKRGHLKKVVIPTETRLTAVVEIEILETCTQKVIQGPIHLKASIDFDHDYYFSHHAVNIFSLGQLNDIDAAHDAAMHPLNRKLAAQVVEYMINSW